MLKHTKIVATVSDQRCEVEFIDALYKAGMNVVRLNTAHMAEEGLTRVVNNVRTVSNRIGMRIAEQNWKFCSRFLRRKASAEWRIKCRYFKQLLRHAAPQEKK